MYETEIKVEISEMQKAALLDRFLLDGFTDKGIVPQADYYTKAVQSQYGDSNTFDIERYRSEGGKFFCTQKAWEKEEGQDLVRKEEEREVTKEEFNAAITAYPEALRILKVRHWFGASFEGREISLSIDSVQFDHSLGMRHFMEPEILVADKAQVPETKEFLRRFVADLLGYEVSRVEESPGMFVMAFKKF